MTGVLERGIDSIYLGSDMAFLQPHHLLALDFRLRLVKGDVALDLVHVWQRIRVVPSRILDLCLIGRHSVVTRVAFVGTVSFGGSGTEVRFVDGVGRKLCWLAQTGGGEW